MHYQLFGVELFVFGLRRTAPHSFRHFPGETDDNAMPSARRIYGTESRPAPYPVRFARHMVADFGHEGTFEVYVPDDIVDAVNEELLRLGCLVRRDEIKSLLIVKCPPSTSH